MKAKFVYEAIGDIFKPKSEEKILASIKYDKNLDYNSLLVQAAKTGFLPGVKILLDTGANVNAQDAYALRWASQNGHYDIVKLLIDNGANVNAYGDGAIFNAIVNSHYEVVKLLLDNGANSEKRSYIASNDIEELLKKYM